MSEPAIVFDSMRMQAIIDEACALIWASGGDIDTDEVADDVMRKIAEVLEEDNGRPILPVRK